MTDEARADEGHFKEMGVIFIVAREKLLRVTKSLEWDPFILNLIGVLFD